MIYPLSVPFPVVHDQGMEAALLLSAQGGPRVPPRTVFLYGIIQQVKH